MKKYSIILLAAILAVICIPVALNAQSVKDKELINDSRNAKVKFIKSDADLNSRFKSAYGYVIFPNVGKGGLGVGGAGGRGILFEHGKAIGKAKLVQVTIGAQAGGQTYREVIFFETKDALQQFKDSKLEFSAQMSAVAVKAGASANAAYNSGVLVFTQEKAGLMAEASIGGQKFTYGSF